MGIPQIIDCHSIHHERNQAAGMLGFIHRHGRASCDAYLVIFGERPTGE